MELVFIAGGIVVLVFTLLGAAIFITFIVTLAYGAWYHNKHERKYKPKYINHQMRKSSLLKMLGNALGHSITIDPAYTSLIDSDASPLLYACRPHGILVVSAWLTFLSGKLDRRGRPVVVAAHSVVCSIPFIRELLLLPLGIIDVSEKSILNAIKNGCSVAIMPGGVREMGPPLFPLPEQPGVIRLGHEYGINVVPVHFGGEDDLFWIWHGEWRIIKWIRWMIFKIFSIPFLVFFFPRVWDWPRELVTHIGAPLLHSKFSSKKDMSKAEKRFVSHRKALEEDLKKAATNQQKRSTKKRSKYI